MAGRLKTAVPQLGVLGFLASLAEPNRLRNAPGGNFPATIHKMATRHAIPAPRTGSGEIRSLFGGAFTCRVPSHYMDVSAVRDIPDHQEVMAEEGPAGRSLIVELLQYLKDVPDHQAARFHFTAVAEANGAEGEGESNVVSESQLDKEQVAMKECSSVWVLVGRQFVAKLHDPASVAHEVELHLALLRLPTHDTDLLVTLNDPVGLRRIDGPGPMVGAADREETEQTFENAFETLKLVDASIFS